MKSEIDILLDMWEKVEQVHAQQVWIRDGEPITKTAEPGWITLQLVLKTIVPGPNPRYLDLKIRTIPDELSKNYCRYLDSLILEFLNSNQRSSTSVADGFTKFKCDNEL